MNIFKCIENLFDIHCQIKNITRQNGIPQPQFFVYDQNFWGEGMVDGEGVALKGA